VFRSIGAKTAVMVALATMAAGAVVANGATSPRSFPGCPALPGAQPAVGGPTLAYITSAGSRLAVARIDGKGRPRVIYPGDASYPSVSPDGKLIAFQRGRNEIWVVRRDGTNAHLVTGGTTPSFSPDGAHLAIGGAQTMPNGYEVDVVDADGRGRRVLARDAAPYPHPSWSPDGSQIAFVGFTREQMDFTSIERVEADGIGETGIRTFGDDPTWSPDGQRIAYTSNGNRSLPTELHRVRPDGSDDHLLARLSSVGATSGAWTGTGAVIFMTLPSDEAGTTSAADGALWQVEAGGRALHPLAPGCIFGTSKGRPHQGHEQARPRVRVRRKRRHQRPRRRTRLGRLWPRTRHGYRRSQRSRSQLRTHRSLTP
jgi:dipeptidyl aminopeptidase/acylaminoacyl peptidase